MRLKRFNINPFGIGGRYAGSITRISDRAVINVSAGGGLLPSVIGRHKRRLLAEEEERGGPAWPRAMSRSTRGYDVDDNAVRFSNYFHVLRELVHLLVRLAAAGAAPRASSTRSATTSTTTRAR